MNAARAPLADLAEDETLLLPFAATALLGMVLFTANTTTDRVWGAWSLIVALAFAVGIGHLQSARGRLAAVVTFLGTGVAMIGLATTDKPLKGIAGPLTLLLPSIAPSPDVTINANAVAYLLAPALCVEVPLAIAARSKLSRAGWITLALVDLTLIALTGSRSGMLGAGVGALIAAALLIRQLRLPLLMAAVSGCGVLVYALLANWTPDLADRALIWRYALSLPANPIVGLGFGGLAAAATSRASADLVGGSTPLNAHNVYLQTFLDFGVPGLVAAAAALVKVIAAYAKHSRHGCERGRTFAAISLSGVVCLMVVGLGESVFSSSISLPVGVITVVSPFPIWIIAAAIKVRCEAADG